jgi:peptidoglycan/LPS O-acetylase OafA/YrhL
VTSLAIVLAVEAVLMLAATALTIVQFAADGARVEADGFAFIACLVIGFLWVGLAAVGVRLERRWARSLTVVWQLIQLVAGIGALEGLVAGPFIGVVLLVLAVAGLVLVFSPPVTRALRRDPA